MIQPVENEQRHRWYWSWPVIIVACLALPPVGLVLLWSRPDGSLAGKVAASILSLSAAAAYVVLALGGPPRIFVTNPDMEAHYDEVERHRARQREQPLGANSEEAAVAPPSGIPESDNTPDKNQPAAPEAKTASNYWTNFRGPSRDGRYDELQVLTTWSPGGPPLIWRQPIGGGYASFSVADGFAFTIEQRHRQEILAAYDLNTGREGWTHTWNAEFRDSTGDGPRATPTWDDGRVYALGATGELRVVNAASGKLIWAQNILTDNGARNLSWGMAASPLVVDDKVILLPGGGNGKSVVAYNKLTGKPVWKVLDDRQAYTSPMLVTLAGTRQILVVTARRVVGLKPEDGSLLWEYPWDTQMGINVSQPLVVDSNRFFISAGYGKGAGLVEVSKTESGFKAGKIWENISMKNKFNSSVLHEGHVYGLDEGILTCVDVETGERKWKGGRYGYGQVLLASGHLIVMSDDGEVVLVEATPERHLEVARFAGLEGKTWNTPALAGGRLLIRNQTEMACYNLAR